MKKLFGCKKIVYTKSLQPGELVKVYTFKGKRYVRLAFTNLVKFRNTIPMTDVAYSDVVGVRKLPSPFKKGVCNLFGIKARATFYKING